jgi:FkbM family methyltransferase
MLLNLVELAKKYNIQPKGLINVGCHWAEEHEIYLSIGIPKMVYIEPCAKAFEELKRRFQYAPNVRLFNLACGDKSEVGVIMYTGDNTINKGQSNSLLKPAKHLRIHPEVEFTSEEMVDVDLLDNFGLIGEPYDLLVMDCQGYEGHVLRGAQKTIEQIKWVYTEVNQSEVYEGCAMVEEIDTLLKDFERVETGNWVGNAWSDAFYVRKNLL